MYVKLKIMENEFVFIDENSEDKNSVFYVEKYYDFVKSLVKDFFKAPLEQNDMHKYFVSLLESLNDYEDVYFIYSEMPFYWAMNIIENNRTNKSLMGEDLERYIEFSKLFKTKNNIEAFIEVITE